MICLMLRVSSYLVFCLLATPQMIRQVRRNCLPVKAQTQDETTDGHEIKQDAVWPVAELRENNEN